MLADMPFTTPGLYAILQQAVLPFMNKDNAAKEGTVIDVSVKSNEIGMFHPLQ